MDRHRRDLDAAAHGLRWLPITRGTGLKSAAVLPVVFCRYIERNLWPENQTHAELSSKFNLARKACPKFPLLTGGIQEREERPGSAICQGLIYLRNAVMC